MDQRDNPTVVSVFQVTWGLKAFLSMIVSHAFGTDTSFRLSTSKILQVLTSANNVMRKHVHVCVLTEQVQV